MKKKRLSVFDKAETAMKEAVDKVVENHMHPVRSLKVTRESMENMKTEKKDHIVKGGTEYIISKYNPKRYLVCVSKSGNIVPVFPFTSKKEALKYIDSQEKKKKIKHKKRWSIKIS
ncbi:MAG: hypothetical protein ABIH85_01065 [Candidatus Omnitrophota bacterium]|nr:hypothetical protein [Candidatus Omnitrophota bacterium]